MKKYYECHITLMGSPEVLRTHVESAKWIFSAIDGDPVLGEGIKCYATKHYNFDKHSEAEVIIMVQALSVQFQMCGLKVLRDKVELVVYDSKTFKIQEAA